MKVQTKSRKNWAKFELNRLGSDSSIRILRKLAEGYSQSEIANQLSFSKTRVFYHASRFLSSGLIREISPGKPKIYGLTALGSKFLTGSERAAPEPCIMEDYPLKFRLLSDQGRISWDKLGEPRNWIKRGCMIGEIRIEKTSQHVIIHTGQLPGFDCDFLLNEAGQIHAIVRARLQDLGVILGEFGVPLHKPIFKYFTPEAEAFNDKIGTLSTEDGSIDASPSPPEPRIPHEEYTREAARARLEMPLRVKRMEALVERQLEISEKQIELQERLIGAIEKSTEVLQGIPGKREPGKNIGVV